MNIEITNFFPSGVSFLELPQFLCPVRTVAKEYIKRRKYEQEVDNSPSSLFWPVTMSESFVGDPRVNEFVQFLGKRGGDFLNAQGVNMQFFNIAVTDLWAQEHRTYSHNEEHVHPFGAQLTGMYFLECPDNCSKIVFHDPRPAKRQLALPQIDTSQITHASDSVFIEPRPGMIYISNAWLPHEIQRNQSNDPFVFVHFNMTVVPKTNVELKCQK